MDPVDNREAKRVNTGNSSQEEDLKLSLKSSMQRQSEGLDDAILDKTSIPYRFQSNPWKMLFAKYQLSYETLHDFFESNDNLNIPKLIFHADKHLPYFIGEVIGIGVTDNEFFEVILSNTSGEIECIFSRDCFITDDDLDIALSKERSELGEYLGGVVPNKLGVILELKNPCLFKINELPHFLVEPCHIDFVFDNFQQK